MILGEPRVPLPRWPAAVSGVAPYALIALLGLHSASALGKVPMAPAPRGPLLVGSIELAPCSGLRAYCGKIDRPLDPTGAIPGRISIHFEYYLHSGPERAVGTLVATEGGPGYPATRSGGDYLALFGPRRRRNDILLMDNRGTGQSGAINCRDLQTAEKWSVELVGTCGASLGESAPLYSTAYAADDLAAILEALGIQRIDLYGDSYGTYFEQVFAVRHPNTLRSIILDGAYPLNGPDYAWYPSYAAAMRRKFDVACRRFEPCAKLPGSSIERMRPVLQELRSHPFPANAPDRDGRERAFTVDASNLAIVMFANSPALSTLREFDAAARAFTNGDRTPLLRLMAETLGSVDSRDSTADPAQWSAGLAAAVMCQDPPQIFDMRLPPVLRRADRDRSIAERKRAFPDTYAPFTIDEYRGMPLDYAFLDQCVDWPVAPSTHPASHVVAVDVPYPDVPALIISGDLDDMTPAASGELVARTFRHGAHLRIANSFHVNALPRARSTCGAQIARRFIETLEPGDTSCAAAVPPINLVAHFAVHAAELEPATALAGNQISAAQLRIVSAAVMTAGDVLTHLEGNSTGLGVGLRGGSFRVLSKPEARVVRVALNEVRWTEDLAVSGTLDADRPPAGEVRASLHVAAADGLAGDLTVQWREGVASSSAAVHGRLGGGAVLARTPPP